MSFAFFCNSVVKLTDRCSCLNPCTVIFNVNLDSSKLGEVYNNEWCFNSSGIRETLIVMASTADSKVNSKLLTANNRCLDMGFIQRSENKLRFWHRRQQLNSS
ncbi:hypothetical protein NC653_004591 [Populus alba x Populus x berolinensis]|uniref:Uncharacterized protein n=1 Tax=Populus alba x Populus x berolinensis TaxID=444605 RepID=A0AAD6RUR0_9ROSI|nr:hypothetical protein NC653_004591 [Populus alba x Populus x berolinensis]